MSTFTPGTRQGGPSAFGLRHLADPSYSNVNQKNQKNTTNNQKLKNKKTPPNNHGRKIAFDIANSKFASLQTPFMASNFTQRKFFISFNNTEARALDSTRPAATTNLFTSDTSVPNSTNCLDNERGATTTSPLPSQWNDTEIDPSDTTKNNIEINCSKAEKVIKDFLLTLTNTKPFNILLWHVAYSSIKVTHYQNQYFLTVTLPTETTTMSATSQLLKQHLESNFLINHPILSVFQLDKELVNVDAYIIEGPLDKPQNLISLFGIAAQMTSNDFEFINFEQLPSSATNSYALGIITQKSEKVLPKNIPFAIEYEPPRVTEKLDYTGYTFMPVAVSSSWCVFCRRKGHRRSECPFAPACDKCHLSNHPTRACRSAIVPVPVTTQPSTSEIHESEVPSSSPYLDAISTISEEDLEMEEATIEASEPQSVALIQQPTNIAVPQTPEPTVDLDPILDHTSTNSIVPYDPPTSNQDTDMDHSHTPEDRELISTQPIDDPDIIEIPSPSTMVIYEQSASVNAIRKTRSAKGKTIGSRKGDQQVPITPSKVAKLRSVTKAKTRSQSTLIDPDANQLDPNDMPVDTYNQY